MPSIIDSTELSVLAEGKTKQIVQCADNANHVIIRSKDKITANDGTRQHELKGKAHISNMTTCAVYEYLNNAGLKTHYIRSNGANEFVAEKCAMIPIEWVTRRVATGSFLQRHPSVKQGHVFTPVKLEIFYKDDANHDPQWSFETLAASDMIINGLHIEQEHIELMSRVSVLVFEILERAWRDRECTLVDMKIEFGINCDGDIVLADNIDCDSWRLWPSGDVRMAKDKQFYRNLSTVTADDLKQLKQDYNWVLEQLKMFNAPSVGLCVILLGSASDLSFGEKIKKTCSSLGVNCVIRVTSAHKDPQSTLNIIQYYQGLSNGLGPVVAGNTLCPVINCPPAVGDMSALDKDVWSSLRMPAGVSCTTVLGAENAGLAVGRIFAQSQSSTWARLRVRALCNYIKLMRGDREANQKTPKILVTKEVDVVSNGNAHSHVQSNGH